MTPKEIMLGCFRGEDVFIEAFYAQYKRLIYSAIYDWMNEYIGHPTDEVKDIFQGVFVKLIEKDFAPLKSVRDIDKPKALIYLIAYYHTAQYFRIQQHEKRIMCRQKQEAAEQERDAVVQELSDDMVRILVEAIAELDEDGQDVLRLYFFGNLQYAEIAVQTGLTKTNVGVIISRAKAHLRSFINRRYPEVLEIL